VIRRYEDKPPLGQRFGLPSDITLVANLPSAAVYPEHKPHTVAEVGSVEFDPTVLPGGNWILLDTYPINGYQHVVLFHRPSRLSVPLAKLKNTAQEDTDYRVDIHARTSRDGRTVCIDATHEGLGRQMYIVPIGYILDRPPQEFGASTNQLR
jgi:hypothetical protein